MARDTEVPHGTRHLGSPTGPDISRDVQAVSVRCDQTGPGNATAAKVASKLFSTTQSARPSLYDFDSSSAKRGKLIPPSVRNHSPSFHRSSVPLQTPSN